MPVLPERQNDRITFLEQRLAKWQANHAQIGVASATVTSLTAMVTDARGKYETALTARNEAKNQTQSFHVAYDGMSSAASDLIKTVRIHAESTNDPEVYALADIPAPATPTPAGPPPAPTDLRSALNQDGSVTLAWKGTTAQSAVFKVFRQLGTSGAFQFMAVTSEKAYTDLSIPAGTIQATYYVIGVRQDLEGPQSVNHVVKLGVQTPEAEEGGGTLSLAA